MKGHDNQSGWAAPEQSEPYWEPLSSVLDLMPDPGLLVDGDGRIVTTNDRATAMFGYEAGALTGQDLEVLIPARLRGRHLRHRADYQRAPWQGAMDPTLELLGRRRDGSEFPVDISLSPVPVAEGLLVIAAVRDMSVRTATAGGLSHLLDAERDRIARGLYDTVIQRLFAFGLALEALRALSTANPAEIDKRLEVVVEGLDSTIREIRSTVFSLERPRRGFAADLLQLARDATPALGLQPQVRFQGAVDVAVSDHLGHQTLAVVREVLAGITHRGEAGPISIDVSVGEGVLRLAVADDDTLIDLTDRAARLTMTLGGEVDQVTLPQGGTRLDWRIPLPR